MLSSAGRKAKSEKLSNEMREDMNRLDYVSNDAALLQIQRYCLQEGKAAGTQMIRICNIAGLELHIAADRAMDIAEFRYQGTPIGYLSATGITHPTYYEPKDYEWLRSFYGGFLTTCGLEQVGDPCQWGSERCGLHGRVSNCPAEQVCTLVQREGDYVTGIVIGVVRQAKQQGEAYLLRRTYQFCSDCAGFTFTDEIENQSAKPLPLQLLYHFNLGYPFLSPTLEIFLPKATIQPVTSESEAIMETYKDSSDPRELTLLHVLQEPEPNTEIRLENGHLCLKIQFDGTRLPMLGQWRHLQPREYVMGLEPANTHLRGVGWEEQHGTLEYLMPGEKKTYMFSVDVGGKTNGQHLHAP